MGSDQTTKENPLSVRGDLHPTPGFIVCFIGGHPAYRPVPLSLHAPVVVGRGTTSSLVLDDERLSRQHTEIGFDGTHFRVRDLESKNGSYVDGARLTSEHASSSARVVRMGQSVLLLDRDITRFGQPHSLFDLVSVAGPTLQAAQDRVSGTAKDGKHLLLLGESGAGKERMAALYHARSPFPKGPYHILNVASLSASLVESELFGHSRGAFSGAAKDRPGLFETAHQGTLFLDEIADMALDAQAKVLRAIQQGEVRRLGENQVRIVDVRLVAGTNADLAARVAANRFRADLYYRLGQGIVRVPPLRERREEIPFLIQIALSKSDPALLIDAGFVEQCLLRAWPGNVRELLDATQAAARIARPVGTGILSASCLDPAAGQILGASATADSGDDVDESIHEAARADRHEREAAVIAAHRRGDDVATIAAKLKIGKSTIYRYIKKHEGPST
jgi:transcriptional regulator with PAS, ATPase and Fis domain